MQEVTKLRKDLSLRLSQAQEEAKSELADDLDFPGRSFSTADESFPFELANQKR